MRSENSMRIGCKIPNRQKVIGTDHLKSIKRELTLFSQSNRVFWSKSVLLQKFAEIGAHFMIVVVDNFLQIFYWYRWKKNKEDFFKKLK